MLLTGSRASPYAQVDAFSDYDVVLVLRTSIILAERTWLQDFGQVLVVYWDPIHTAPGYGIEQVGNVTQYEDGPDRFHPLAGRIDAADRSSAGASGRPGHRIYYPG